MFPTTRKRWILVVAAYATAPVLFFVALILVHNFYTVVDPSYYHRIPTYTSILAAGQPDDDHRWAASILIVGGVVAFGLVINILKLCVQVVVEYNRHKKH